MQYESPYHMTMWYGFFTMWYGFSFQLIWFLKLFYSLENNELVTILA